MEVLKIAIFDEETKERKCNRSLDEFHFWAVLVMLRKNSEKEISFSYGNSHLIFSFGHIECSGVCRTKVSGIE